MDSKNVAYREKETLGIFFILYLNFNEVLNDFFYVINWKTSHSKRSVFFSFF